MGGTAQLQPKPIFISTGHAVASTPSVPKESAREHVSLFHVKLGMKNIPPTIALCLWAFWMQAAASSPYAVSLTQRPQSSLKSPLKGECPGPLSYAATKTPDVGKPHLRVNPDCLAAHYDFADFDPATGFVRDKSGNGFDLTAVGQRASVADGVAGKGVRLAGGYFQAKGNPLARADHFTISLWFKTAEPMNNYKLISAAVWSGGNNASGWNVGTHYSEFWADDQQGSLRGDPGWERGVEFRKGEWNHLVVTYDGAYVREYINGQQSAEIHGTGRRVGNGVPMLVGAWMGFQFHGVLDEVRIHRRALKVMEIQALHKAPGGRH